MAFVFKGAEQVLSSDVVSGLTISQDDPIDAAIVAYGGIIGGGSLSLMDFQSGSSLLLDASASFHAPVPGFGTSDQIDLRAFVSATTKKGQTGHLSFTEAAGNLSGTLIVTDGVHTASIQMIGSYIARDYSGRRWKPRHPPHLHVGDIGVREPRSRQRDRVGGDLVTDTPREIRPL
jgi:hypothetical protein